MLNTQTKKNIGQIVKLSSRVAQKLNTILELKFNFCFNKILEISLKFAKHPFEIKCRWYIEGDVDFN